MTYKAFLRSNHPAQVEIKRKKQRGDRAEKSYARSRTRNEIFFFVPNFLRPARVSRTFQGILSGSFRNYGMIVV